MLLCNSQVERYSTRNDKRHVGVLSGMWVWFHAWLVASNDQILNHFCSATSPPSLHYNLLQHLLICIYLSLVYYKFHTSRNAACVHVHTLTHTHVYLLRPINSVHANGFLCPCAHNTMRRLTQSTKRACT